MSRHWAFEYINKPWVAGGRGPEDFDCWGLLRFVQFHELRRPLLPSYPVPPADKKGVSEAIEDAIAGPEWLKLSRPIHGCAVGMSLGTYLHHVGIFLAIDGGGLILHALEGKGVQVSAPERLRGELWRRIEFYQHVTWTKTP